MALKGLRQVSQSILGVHVKVRLSEIPCFLVIDILPLFVTLSLVKYGTCLASPALFLEKENPLKGVWNYLLGSITMFIYQNKDVPYSCSATFHSSSFILHWPYHSVPT